MQQKLQRHKERMKELLADFKKHPEALWDQHDGAQIGCHLDWKLQRLEDLLQFVAEHDNKPSI